MPYCEELLTYEAILASSRLILFANPKVFMIMVDGRVSGTLKVFMIIANGQSGDSKIFMIMADARAAVQDLRDLMAGCEPRLPLPSRDSGPRRLLSQVAFLLTYMNVQDIWCNYLKRRLGDARCNSIVNNVMRQ